MHSTSYSYSKDGNSANSCPCLDILIMNPLSSDRNIIFNALIDTGSDFTLIPVDRLYGIEAKPVGDYEVIEGIGRIAILPFFVSLELAGMQLPYQKVWGWRREKALIGRDLINQWRINLDGPVEEFVIYHPPYACS